MRAIEAHAGDLSGQWTRPSSTGTPGWLFPDAPEPRHRDQATTQTQLRISPAAADVLDELDELDELVGRWQAPSRSALINEALRRYLTQNQETP